MYDTRTEGTPGAFRRSGAAGRPRAASQAGLRATQRDAGGRQPRTIEHAQSMLLSRWRPGGRAASPTTRGHRILYFHDFRWREGYKSVVPLLYPQERVKSGADAAYRTPGVPIARTTISHLRVLVPM